MLALESYPQVCLEWQALLIAFANSLCFQSGTSLEPASMWYKFGACLQNDSGTGRCPQTGCGPHTTAQLSPRSLTQQACCQLYLAIWADNELSHFMLAGVCCLFKEAPAISCHAPA